MMLVIFSSCREELDPLQEWVYTYKYLFSYIMTVESTLLGIIIVSGSELLDVDLLRW